MPGLGVRRGRVPGVAAGLLILGLVAHGIARGMVLRNWHYATCGPWPDPCQALPLGELAFRQLGGITEWGLPVVGAAVAGVLLVRRGWRWGFLLPGMMVSLVPWAMGDGPWALTDLAWPSPWAGVGFELGLALLPAAWVLDAAPRPWPDLDRFHAAAMGLSAFGLVLLLATRDVLYASSSSQVAALAAVFVAGVGLGTRRLSLAWAVLVALLLSHGYAGQWWWWEPSSWPQAGIALLSVGMGAAWEPIAGVIRRAADRPLALRGVGQHPQPGRRAPQRRLAPIRGRPGG